MVGEAALHDAEQSIGLVGEALDRVGDLLLRVEAEMVGLSRDRPETADLPEQPFADRDLFARVEPPKRPVLSARYCRIAPDSKIEMGAPSGPSGSTIAGMRLFGEISRKPGSNCSPVVISTIRNSYGKPHSSSMIETFHPFGVGQ